MNQLQNLAATGRDRMESRHLADHLGEAASRPLHWDNGHLARSHGVPPLRQLHNHLEEPHRRLLRRRRPFNRFPITVPRCPVIRADMRNMG